MQENRFGRIVNVSSVTAFNGGVQRRLCSLKAGIIVQTKSFARRFGLTIL